MEMSKETIVKGVAVAGTVGAALGYAAIEAVPAGAWMSNAQVETHCVPGEGNGQAEFQLTFTNTEPSGRDMAAKLVVDGKTVDEIEDAKPLNKDGSANPVHVSAVYHSAPVGLKELKIERTWVNQAKFGNQVDTETVQLNGVEACPPPTTTTKPPVTTTTTEAPKKPVTTPTTVKTEIGTAINISREVPTTTTTAPETGLPNTGGHDTHKEVWIALALLGAGAGMYGTKEASKRGLLGNDEEIKESNK